MSMVFKRWLSLALALLLGSACLRGLAADLTAAKAKAKMCAACHGIDGIAKVADAPILAGNGELYLARQLQAFRSGERKHPQMSVIASGLSDEDIAAVTAWYSAIKVSVELPE
jgi:cytochrome c553